MKILVLSGGTSNEREVSLRSGVNVMAALREAGFDIVEADPGAEGIDLAKLVQGVDLVIPILHGAGGEDGQLQAELEALGVRYLGSDSKASALAFHKHKTKQHLASRDIITPCGQLVSHDQFHASELKHKPHVLKPVDGGSSIDTHIAHHPAASRAELLEPLFAKYGQLLLEELIVGHEITVGVLGDEALPIILIVPPAGGEFDYENKYNGKTSEIVAPLEVSPELTKRAQQLALDVHRELGLKHLSRTDMIITSEGQIYVLEANTMPGMTEQSLYPKAAQAAGMSMADLMKRLVELSMS